MFLRRRVFTMDAVCNGELVAVADLLFQLT
jgi:hypothetical protein